MTVDPNPTACYFEVPGPFATKGSTVSFKDRRGIIRTKTDSKYARPFAAAVQWAARQAGIVKVPAGVGVNVSAIYSFARPKGRDRWRLTPCVRPDADKLARMLLDALTGVAWDDDGQVTSLNIRKIYAPTARARIVILAEPE